MRRRHREIAGGEVAMMAVITKAMGAFLVLMILLLPYYTGDTKSQETVDETKQRIDQAKAGLDGAVDKLKKGRLTDAEIDDLLKSLMLARDELVEAQNLISQLRIKVDQMASQINRLEQQNTVLQDQVAQLQGEIVTLKGAVAALVTENLALKSAVVDLTAKVSALEAANATLNQQNAELQAKIKDIEKQLEAVTAENTALKASIADLTAKVSTLETANAALTQENASLKAEIERLKAFDPETLKARIRELEKQVEDLTAKLNDLEGANTTLKQQNVELSNENTDLKRRGQFNPVAYVVSDCSGHQDLVVHLVTGDGFKTDAAYNDVAAAGLMPWAMPLFRPHAGPAAKLDGKSVYINAANLLLAEGDNTWDFFLQLNLDDDLATRYANEAFGKNNLSDGSILSSEKSPSCKATAFIEWQDTTIELGTYRLGFAEPVIHVGHANLHIDGKFFNSSDKRPELPRHLANAVCAHFSALCVIAKRHAEWRVLGQDPWVHEKDDPGKSPPSPQQPAMDDKTPGSEDPNSDPLSPPDNSVKPPAAGDNVTPSP